MLSFKTDAIHQELFLKGFSVSYQDSQLVYNGNKEQIDAIISTFDETSFVKQMASDRITAERVKETEKLVNPEKWILILAQSIYIMQRQRKGLSTQKENTQLDQLEGLMDAISALIEIEKTEIGKLDALTIAQMVLVDGTNIKW